MTSLDRSNTHEFKFKGKNIVLKLVKSKSNVRNNKEGIITDKNNNTLCFLMTRSQSSLEALVDRSITTLRNFLGLLPLTIGIQHIVTIEPSASHLPKLHDHIKMHITFNHYNDQPTVKSHKRLQELAKGDEVLIRVHLERFQLRTLKMLHTRCNCPYKILRRFSSSAYKFNIPRELEIILLFSVENLTR